MQAKAAVPEKATAWCFHPPGCRETACGAHPFRLLARSFFLALTIALTSSAIAGAVPRHGSGFRLAPNAAATWWSFGRPTNPATRVPIDPSAQPFGPTGDGPLDNTQFVRRYAGGDATLPQRGGMTPQGEANERAFHTALVLAAACKDGLFGADWDCVATALEVQDFAFTVARGTGLYQRYDCLFTAQGCTACPPCRECPPQVCPAMVCAKPPASLKTATDRLAAAATLSRSRPVNIGPALRSYIGQVLGYVAAEHPCVPRTP